jgi:hypothetical protein
MWVEEERDQTSAPPAGSARYPRKPNSIGALDYSLPHPTVATRHRRFTSAILMLSKGAKRMNFIGQGPDGARDAAAILTTAVGSDLPPISHPLITGVSPFRFCFEIISQPS